MMCPCHSKKPYATCCEPFHLGKRLPANALELMRSRYSAYALQLAQYIIDTTYSKAGLKRSEILQFCKQTQFLDLIIIEFVDGKETASVTFCAVLAQGFQDISFQEKSLFRKVSDRWHYLHAETIIQN